jgi:hypothetical protein
VWLAGCPEPARSDEEPRRLPVHPRIDILYVSTRIRGEDGFCRPRYGGHRIGAFRVTSPPAARTGALLGKPRDRQSAATV